MVKNETFTLYFGSETPEAEEAADDLEDGVFSDEEDLNRIRSKQVAGCLTENTYRSTEASIRLYVLSSTKIDVDYRVKRDKTGMIYVVNRVTVSKLAGSDKVVELREA